MDAKQIEQVRPIHLDNEQLGIFTNPFLSS